MVLKGRGTKFSVPRPNSQFGYLFTPERQREGNKRQGQEIEDKEEGKETRERRQESFIQKDKALPLVTKETDTVHRKMAVYKRKRENSHVRMWC